MVTDYSSQLSGIFLEEAAAIGSFPMAYRDVNYLGAWASLPPGSYTTAQLAARGVADNDNRVAFGKMIRRNRMADQVNAFGKFSDGTLVVGGRIGGRELWTEQRCDEEPERDKASAGGRKES